MSEKRLKLSDYTETNERGTFMKLNIVDFLIRFLKEASCCYYCPYPFRSIIYIYRRMVLEYWQIKILPSRSNNHVTKTNDKRV